MVETQSFTLSKNSKKGYIGNSITLKWHHCSLYYFVTPHAVSEQSLNKIQWLSARQLIALFTINYKMKNEIKRKIIVVCLPQLTISYKFLANISVLPHSSSNYFLAFYYDESASMEQKRKKLVKKEILRHQNNRRIRAQRKKKICVTFPRFYDCIMDMKIPWKYLSYQSSLWSIL